MKKNLYVISGATGMTGSELSHQLLKEENIVVGFDNFFASSIDTVKDLVGRDVEKCRKSLLNNQGLS